MIQFPKNLETFLLDYLKREFYRGTRREVFIDRPFGEEDLRFFSKGASRLSDLFTTERSEIDRAYLKDPVLRAGYLLYFLPINFTKTRFVLEQIPASFWKKKNLRILDLGAGPGSAGLAVAETLRRKNPEAKAEWVLVDQNEPILKDASRLFEGFLEKGPRVKTVRSELRRFRPEGRFDLILLSHCLNEWGSGANAAKSEWVAGLLSRHLDEAGIAVLLEPALKRPTRDLMGIRDRLVETGHFTILAPCLHDRGCPMLEATSRDWCHFYVSWDEPDFLKRLDLLIGNENRFLKVAYLLLGNGSAWEGRIERSPHSFRVVSNRMATRGKTELVLCGPPGRVHLTRLDRERSEANASLDRVARGDLIKLPGQHFPGYEIDRKYRLGKNEKLL